MQSALRGPPGGGMISSVLRASCRLFSSGQSCADCPQRGLQSCPLPDIEDLFMNSAPSPPKHAIRRRVSAATPRVPRFESGTPMMINTASHRPGVPRSLAQRPAIDRVPVQPKDVASIPAWQAITQCPASGCAAMSTLAAAGVAPHAESEGSATSTCGTSTASHLASMLIGSFRGDNALRPNIPKVRVMDAPVSLAGVAVDPVELSSTEGKAMFQDALASGGLEGYFSLAQHAVTQPDVRMSPISTLSVVLNALSHDPGVRWKGPWRWNSEEMMLCQGSSKGGSKPACGHSPDLLDRSMTMAEFAALARCKGVRAVRHGVSGAGGVEALRSKLREVCGDEDATQHMVVNIARGGARGHFCTVGGYSAERDMVLVLDVARHSHPPQWMRVDALWAAMDCAGGKELGGGYAVISSWATEKPTSAELCPTVVRSWSEIVQADRDAVKGRRNASPPTEIEVMLRAAVGGRLSAGGSRGMHNTRRVVAVEA